MSDAANTTDTSKIAPAAGATDASKSAAGAKTESAQNSTTSAAGDVKGAFEGGDAGVETKGAEGDAKATEAKPGDDKKPAPIELKLPEGAQYDAAELEGLKKFATDSGLSGEAAQKLLEFDLAREGARATAAQAAAAAQEEAWAKQVMADKELGGEKWAETQQHIARARAHFGAPVESAQKFLKHVGLITHPVVVKLFAELGRSVKEDTVKGALTPAQTKAAKSDAEIF